LHFPQLFLVRSNIFIYVNKFPLHYFHLQGPSILDSPYYVFVALCIVVIVVSLIKIAASNEIREYFAVGYRAPDPSFF
jgi:hypothetical protein